MCDKNVPMQQETILSEFGQICATGNASLMQLEETILCEFGRICATGNVICTAENAY